MRLLERRWIVSKITPICILSAEKTPVFRHPPFSGDVPRLRGVVGKRLSGESAQ